MSISAVRRGLEDLVTFLEHVQKAEPADEARARRAVVNLRGEIAEINRLGHTTAVDEVLGSVLYAMSEKGIFDWAWTPVTEARLRELSDRVVMALLHARRRR